MKHSVQYRVPYADTDQMGVVYYANYLEYFERSRTEMLRDGGLPYSELEKMGVFLPVSEAKVKYLSPARYDDLLTIVSWVDEARGAKLGIASQVFRDGELLAEGSVILVCVNDRRRPARLPEVLLEKCRNFMEEDRS